MPVGRGAVVHEQHVEVACGQLAAGEPAQRHHREGHLGRQVGERRLDARLSPPARSGRGPRPTSGPGRTPPQRRRPAGGGAANGAAPAAARPAAARPRRRRPKRPGRHGRAVRSRSGVASRTIRSGLATRMSPSRALVPSRSHRRMATSGWSRRRAPALSSVARPTPACAARAGRDRDRRGRQPVEHERQQLLHHARRPGEPPGQLAHGRPGALDVEAEGGQVRRPPSRERRPALARLSSRGRK